MARLLISLGLLLVLVAMTSLAQSQSSRQCYECTNCGATLGTVVICDAQTPSCYKNVETIESTTTVSRGCTMNVGNRCNYQNAQIECFCDNYDLCNAAPALTSRDRLSISLLTASAATLLTFAVRR